MTRATINARANGAWTCAYDVEVEVIELTSNGRAVTVRMPPDAPIHANRRATIPYCWVTRHAADSPETPQNGSGRDATPSEGTDRPTPSACRQKRSGGRRRRSRRDA